MSDAERTPLQRRVVGALQEATVITAPFPHFFATNVFPDDVYAHIRDVLREKTNYKSTTNGGTGSYSNRTFSNTHELPELDFMFDKTFFKDVLMLFAPQVKEKYGGTGQQFTRDLRLIRDHENYKIGPHTDTIYKVISLLFYLPEDDRDVDCGTTFYRPKRSFVPDNDPEHRRHYDFSQFIKIGSVPFAPNTCLGFWRTDYSWHGVPPIKKPIDRDVLLYNIYVPEHNTQAEPQSDSA